MRARVIRLRLCFLLVVLFVALRAERAHAQSDAAATPTPQDASAPGEAPAATASWAALHYDRGMELFAARKYAAAAAEFRTSYALDANRETLFAEAQAVRLDGDCPTAVALYVRFLASDPPARQVEATRLALARCAGKTGGALAPATLPTAKRGGQTAAVEAQVPPGSPRFAATAYEARKATAVVRPAFWRDRRAGALAVGGGVLAAIGVAIIVAAHRQEPALDNIGDYARGRTRAQDLLDWGTGTLLLGTAALTAGVARWVWVGVHGGTTAAGLGTRF